MQIFFLIILGLYVSLILLFVVGWERTPQLHSQKEERQSSTAMVDICVVVAMKNESKQLPTFFSSMENQQNTNFEIVIVDDHSSDASASLVKEWGHATLLSNDGTGKKEAIRTAVERVQTRYIVTVDVDCVYPPKWIDTIVNYLSIHDLDLGIMPVEINSGNGLLWRFQQFEFATLIGAGAGATGVGIPILCNGANLLFSREAWLESTDELQFKEPSGDDIFLLQSIKRRKGRIVFLKSENLMARTLAKGNVQDLLHQRSRWAGKGTAFVDWPFTATALIVFLMVLSLLVVGVWSLFNGAWWTLFVLLFVVKMAVDTLFFFRIKTFFHLRSVFFSVLGLSFIYPFYVLGATLGAVLRTKSW